MPNVIEPTSSPHHWRGETMAKGIKRPRKSTQREVAAQMVQTTTSTVGPCDILKPRPSTSALAQDEMAAYSATPSSLPAKKLSRGRGWLASRNSTDEEPSQQPQQHGSNRLAETPLPSVPTSGSSSSVPSMGKRPVKSALASSVRLATMGMPSGSGIVVSSAYRRTMHIEYVKNAFLQRERGSSKDYSALVSQFRSSALSQNLSATNQSLSLWLSALSYQVSQLDAANHSQLIENILDLPWAAASEEFVKGWCRFVCALVSARTEWASSILTRIVKAMKWRSDWMPFQPVNATADGSTSPQKVTRRLLYGRVHLLLRAILTLVPTLPSTLSPLLIRHFPHKREGKKEQATYIRNILFISLYESQVAETVWRAVADRAINLDVEIQIELDELENGALAAGIEDDLANSDPFDRPLDQEESSSDGEDVDGDGSDSDSEEEGTGFEDISDDEVNHKGDGNNLHASLLQEEEEERKQRKVREMVGKLDSVLKVCFEHLDRVGRGERGRIGAGDRSTAEIGREFEKVLDSRQTWLHDFLGTINGGSNNCTPSATHILERSQSQPIRANNSKQKTSDADLDDAILEDLAEPTSVRLMQSASPVSSSSSSTSIERDEELHQAARHSLFQHLLNLFSRSILPTFRCRHVQFLLFWYCSLESDFADYFLGLLIHKAIYSSPSGDVSSGHGEDKRGWDSRGDPMVLRQAAASYVASFVSRAKYITPQYTRTVVFNLCSFLEAHIDEHANAVRSVLAHGLNGVEEGTARLADAPPGSEEHAIFYAVAQAVFYIFCFRWQDLQTGGPGDVAAGDTAVKQRRSQPRSTPLPDDDLLDTDPGFMFGSLSSTGSSSFALSSSLHRPSRPPPPKTDLWPPSASPNLLAAEGQKSMSSSAKSSGYPLSPPLSATIVPATASHDTDVGTASAWSSGLGILQRAIVCELNPLQFCSATVVQQFASVSQHVGFLYCWSVIDANRRGVGGDGAQSGSSRDGENKTSTSSASMTSSRVTRANNANKALTKDLEGFFPFDPYRLHSTADRFVQPLYREWKDVVPAGLNDEDDDDDEEEEEESRDASEGEESGDSSSDGEASSAEIESTSSSVLKLSRPGLGIPAKATGERGELDPEEEADSQHFAKSMEAMSVVVG